MDVSAAPTKYLLGAIKLRGASVIFLAIDSLTMRHEGRGAGRKVTIGNQDVIVALHGLTTGNVLLRLLGTRLLSGPDTPSTRDPREGGLVTTRPTAIGPLLQLGHPDDVRPPIDYLPCQNADLIAISG